MIIPKFRVYDKSTKCMSNVEAIVYTEKRVYPFYSKVVRRYIPFEECVLMQSTSLKDKNGKEIYEGDIVRFTLTDGFNYVTNEDGVVTYKLGAFYVVNGLAEYLISDINTNKVEVIGNEFEIEVRMK